MDGVKPFDGKGAVVNVAKPINFVQLAKELRQKLPDGVSFVGHGSDLEKPVGKDNPMEIHFSTKDVPLQALQAVVGNHEPDEYHGLSEERVQLLKLRKQLAESDLSLKDVNTYLRLSLGKR